MSERVSANPYREVAQKWRDLAERRRAHFVELYSSGRWRRYYTAEQFLARLHEVIAAAKTWEQIAAPPDERPVAAE